MKEEATAYRLSEYDDDDNDRYQSTNQKHSLQRRKSVSFFDIDTVHYYNSDDCSETSYSSSSSSDTSDSSCCTFLEYDDIANDLTSMILHLLGSQSPLLPYFRLDLAYRIPPGHMARLQEHFRADIDLVGEFFAGVHMYEVWSRE
jgi:hypothetical protein